MNMRLACDLCGCQPCMCQTFDCPGCEGEGTVYTMADETEIGQPPGSSGRDCQDCAGSGEVKCNGPVNGKCPFDEFITGDWMCHCEAAWDRQQEANASEPPPSARERQELAQRERDALRSGRPL